MEFHGDQRNLWSFMDEERKSIKLPRRLSFGSNQQQSSSSEVPNIHLASAARPSNAASEPSIDAIPPRPMSPSTPWTLSPVRTSPSQPLLYHCIASLHRHEGNIFSITLSKDFIFTGSESSRIHAWKQPDCTEIGYIKATSGQVRAILAYGKMLFTTHGDCKIRVWDASSTENFRPKKITSLPQRNRFSNLFSKKSSQQHNDHISCLAYNKEDKLLYTGSWDKSVKAWKINEKRCVDSFIAHEGHVNGIVINQEDGCVFTCSSDGSVKIWRRVFGESSHILTMTLKFQLSPVNALALSLSNSTTLLYSGSSDGLINFWEKEKMSGRYNHGGFLQGHHFAVLCLVALGELIFSGSEDATIRVWRREEGNCFHSCLSVIEGHHGPVRCLAVSLETENVVRVKGLLVYSASLDQTFKVWRVKVFPTEKLNLDESAKDPQREILECETSPVLSPSWVEKKLQGNFFQ
ncbi:putative [Myosin heavy-chain] kinase transcription factor WD40-like family [Rosa chinensis]|uniref:Putative [Myosin heavy-chain] kinase transcription factor WD40-like family n=2 Tax=Rosa chinensis TaxID=74649 RepID=A0A2P6RX49_ROSCH|nr:putative [Myosin heavy-chain] kinase transcription factor WD40-like family [Rosa chinensis]